MTNTVTVTLPAGYIEPTPADNTASDTDTQNSQADLSVSKDDGVTLISPGTTITYTIVVSNLSPSDVWGAEVTDTIPAQIDSWTWACTGTTGGASGCTGVTNSVVDFSDTVDLPANSSITYTVTAQVSAGASGTLTNEVTVTAPAGVTEIDLNNNTDDDIDGFPTSAKDLTGSLHGVTTLPDVAIGEVLTYEAVLDVPQGSMTNLHLIDTLDRGLAFVSCDVITAEAGLTTNGSADFSTVCANPTVSTYPAGSPDDEDLGRQVDFNFGLLENTGGGIAQLTVRYDVVVLDSLGNQSGSTPPLNNEAEWIWDSGDLSDQATGVVILESDLTLIKSVYPKVVYPGQSVTFTLTIDHSAISETFGYDLELTDIVPTKLNYIAGSLQHISGQAPTSLDDTGAPTLVVRWAVFDNTAGNSVIEFDVTLDNNFRRRHYNQTITNDASLTWTSLPGDFSSAQSSHNPLSTERYYDPLSNVNIYGVSDGAVVRIPALPDTGFAPGRETPLPVQSENQLYGDLEGLQLEIPTLNLSLPIVSIPQSDQGWDLTWLWNQAGWLEGTAYPSWYGNTVLTGHAYLSNGLPGPLVHLGTLSWGDEIILYAHGLKYTYQVRVRDLVSADDLRILDHKDQDWLTLFTCKDYSETLDEYLWRQVVQAVLIDVEQLD
jgi:LPXTG-site transpeptidase (sortase) family protein